MLVTVALTGQNYRNKEKGKPAHMCWLVLLDKSCAIYRGILNEGERIEVKKKRKGYNRGTRDPKKMGRRRCNIPRQGGLVAFVKTFQKHIILTKQLVILQNYGGY